jgi:hypothetical protein
MRYGPHAYLGEVLKEVLTPSPRKQRGRLFYHLFAESNFTEHAVACAATQAADESYEYSTRKPSPVQCADLIVGYAVCV